MGPWWCNAIFVSTVKDGWDYAQIVATIAVGAALVFIGWRQVLWMKRQVFADRPHLFLQTLRSPDFGSLSEKAEQPHVLFAIGNMGRSPAFVREFSMRLRIIDEPIPKKPDYGLAVAVKEDAFILIPGKETTLERKDLEDGLLTPDRIIALRHIRTRLMFYGRVCYQDMLAHSYETRFCLSYNPDTRQFDLRLAPKAYYRHT